MSSGIEKLRPHQPVELGLNPNANVALAGALLSMIYDRPVSAQPDDVLESMSSEQSEQAMQLTGVMAERFSLPESDFSVVSTIEPKTGKNLFTVTYAGEKGLLVGTPKSILKKRKSSDFMTELDDGQVFDTRTGMTPSVYSRLVANAREAGQPLPDSRGTRTILTGKNDGRYYISTRYVKKTGQVMKSYTDLKMRHPSHRFRPAVRIPDSN